MSTKNGFRFHHVRMFQVFDMRHRILPQKMLSTLFALQCEVQNSIQARGAPRPPPPLSSELAGTPSDLSPPPALRGTARLGSAWSKRAAAAASRCSDVMWMWRVGDIDQWAFSTERNRERGQASPEQPPPPPASLLSVTNKVRKRKIY